MHKGLTIFADLPARFIERLPADKFGHLTSARVDHLSTKALQAVTAEQWQAFGADNFAQLKPDVVDHGRSQRLAVKQFIALIVPTETRTKVPFMEQRRLGGAISTPKPTVPNNLARKIS